MPDTTHLLSGGGPRDGHGDTEDGIGSELALVGGSVKLDEEVIDGLLVLDIEVGLDKSRGDDVVHVGDSLGHT